MFHWLDNLPLIVLVGMAVVIYFLGCVVEVKRVQTEVRMINELTR
jgi:preprotein translocase subunit YajC